MTKHKAYVRALQNQPSDWILKSAQNPNAFMTKFDVLLHYVVLRQRGVI